MFFFCKLHDKTIMHLFNDYLIVKRIWSQLKSILSNNFLISTPQKTIFGFWDLDTNEHLILKKLLFKMYIYNARTTGYLDIIHLLIYIKGIKGRKRNYVKMMQKGEKKSIRN